MADALRVMLRRQWLTPAPILLGLMLGIGCSSNSNPNLDQVGHLYYSAYCAKLHECMGDSFSASFPGGETDCVDSNFKEINQLSSLQTVCSLEQWQQCADDLRTTTCTCTPASSCPLSKPAGPVIPASCNGC